MRSRLDRKTILPLLALALLVFVPLIIWALSSSDAEGLIVEPGTSAFTGQPELVVSLGEKDDNTVEQTGGKASVRVTCTDASGKVIVQTLQDWPFIEEPGFDYPHVHVTADPDKVSAAARCKVTGTRKELEGRVRR